MKRSKSPVTGDDVQCAERLHTYLTSYVGYCLHKVALRWRAKIDRKLAGHRLIAPQFGMLTILKIEGSMTQNELGTYMAIDKATMVRLIDRLEELGFVKRAQHAEDRRAKMLELTDKGRKTHAALEKLRVEAEKEFLEPLTASERQLFKEAVSKLVRA